MKIVTRHSVFETNSSSTHSISWAGASNIEIPIIALDDQDRYFVSCGEFGWEEASYKYSKAAYTHTPNTLFN